MLRVLVFCLASVLALPAMAQAPVGADDPKLAAAKTAWLAGDDSAFETLRDLSEAGNDAATLLFARLIQSNWYSGREPAEIFGPHDVLYKRIADRSPHAQALLALGVSPMSDADVAAMAAAYFRLGEPLLGYRTITNRGVHGFYGRFVKFPPDVLALAIDPKIDFTLRATMFKTISGLFPTPLQQKTIAEHCTEQARTGAFAPFGAWCAVRGTERDSPVSMTAFTGSEDVDPPTARIVGEWLMSDAPAFARICNAACPKTPTDCAFRVHQVNSGIFGHASLRSPLEALIPQAEYWTSQRAALDLWSNLSAHAERVVTYDGALEKDKRLSACLRTALTAITPPWTKK